MICLVILIIIHQEELLVKEIQTEHVTAVELVVVINLVALQHFVERAWVGVEVVVEVVLSEAIL